jgi:hypothetical protein
MDNLEKLTIFGTRGTRQNKYYTETLKDEKRTDPTNNRT